MRVFHLHDSDPLGTDKCHEPAQRFAEAIGIL